jgi:hypothetical protein
MIVQPVASRYTDPLRLTIYACYSWEVALNFGLDLSSGNKQEWKGMWETGEEVDSTEAYN